jgi:hypothetical protein
VATLRVFAPASACAADSAHGDSSAVMSRRANALSITKTAGVFTSTAAPLRYFSRAPTLQQGLQQRPLVAPDVPHQRPFAVERLLVVAVHPAPERLILQPLGALFDRLHPGSGEALVRVAELVPALEAGAGELRCVLDRPAGRRAR